MVITSWINVKSWWKLNFATRKHNHIWMTVSNYWHFTESSNIKPTWLTFQKYLLYHLFIISPNEVFGDIMVLASPPPCPPPRPSVDPDYVNTLTRNIINLSLSNCICGYIPPCGTLLLKFDTLRRVEQLNCVRSQATLSIPQIFTMQHLHK